jgi:molecular chaperone DnaJ
MKKRDYYDVLGVPRNATAQEVRHGFRRLARMYSPDVNVWEDDRTSGLFDEIVEAYRVLSDSGARAAYDRLGHQAFDVAGGVASPGEERGEDLHCPVEIDFMEALHGVTATLDVTRREACPVCAGTGSADRRAAARCESCEGRPVRVVSNEGLPVAVRCEACGATGWRIGPPCSGCGGRGTTARRTRLSVSIPAGVDTGAQIRLPGEGHAGRPPGGAGDLVVITRVRPHPFFTRKGDNLYCEVPITVPEAALGARIQVPTPEGAAVVTVPPGTQSGQVFRLRGKGCPRLDRDGRGDLFVATAVRIPRNADATLEQVLRALERLWPEDPRATLWSPRGAS